MFDGNFLLNNQYAIDLYNNYAKDARIYDYHCHLDPKEIWENRKFADLGEIWLARDHYKWKAMRNYGISEYYITGESSSYEKYLKWVEVLQVCVGNPLYHWSNMELAIYFGIEEPLTLDNAQEIWDKVNVKLQDWGARDFITMSNVDALITTEDPEATLEYHQLIAEDDTFPTKVLAAFRPDNILAIDKATFAEYIPVVGASAGVEIVNLSTLKQALINRIDFFDSLGCVSSDHLFRWFPYNDVDDEEADDIFQKAMRGEALTIDEIDGYRTNIFLFMCREYNKRDWGMQIHIGSIQHNNTRMYDKLGAGSGYNAINDYPVSLNLSNMLNNLEETEELPKTVIFNLHPKDNVVLATLLGDFQEEHGASYSKIQFGSAWWFLDNIDGMEAQMKELANNGVLAKFIGMLTDSRSFLSFSRFDYFRRILCNIIGTWIDEGKYIDPELKYSGKIVADICYNNAVEYYKFDERRRRV